MILLDNNDKVWENGKCDGLENHGRNSEDDYNKNEEITNKKTTKKKKEE